MKRNRKILFLLLSPIAGSWLGCSGVIDGKANALLIHRLDNTSFTVYPTIVRAKDLSSDADSAAVLAQLIENEHFGTARLSAIEVPVGGEWRMNQAKMFRKSATQFAAFVQANPNATDYSVLAECLMVHDQVLGAHLYVVDDQGRIAEGILSNSHQKAFSSRAPKTVGDCVTVVGEILRTDWNQAKEEVNIKTRPH